MTHLAGLSTFVLCFIFPGIAFAFLSGFCIPDGRTDTISENNDHLLAGCTGLAWCTGRACGRAGLVGQLVL